MACLPHLVVSKLCTVLDVTYMAKHTCSGSRACKLRGQWVVGGDGVPGEGMRQCVGRTVHSGGRAFRPNSASGGTQRLDLRLRHERVAFARMRTSQDRFADAITAFAGTMGFV